MTGNAERRCAWCGAAFVPPRLGAPKKYCRANCKNAAQRNRAGVEGREKARNAMANWYAANREYAIARQRAYNAADPERKRQQDAEFYHRHKGKRKMSQREWTRRMKSERPDEYRRFLGDQRERRAKREAAAALSTLLLPTHQPPQEQDQ